MKAFEVYWDDNFRSGFVRSLDGFSPLVGDGGDRVERHLMEVFQMDLEWWVQGQDEVESGSTGVSHEHWVV